MVVLMKKHLIFNSVSGVTCKRIRHSYYRVSRASFPL